MEVTEADIKTTKSNTKIGLLEVYLVVLFLSTQI